MTAERASWFVGFGASDETGRIKAPKTRHRHYAAGTKLPSVPLRSPDCLEAWAEGRVQALTHSSKACDSDRLCAATESPTDVEQFWALGGGGTTDALSSEGIDHTSHHLRYFIW